MMPHGSKLRKTLEDAPPVKAQAVSPLAQRLPLEAAKAASLDLGLGKSSHGMRCQWIPSSVLRKRVMQP